MRSLHHLFPTPTHTTRSFSTPPPTHNFLHHLQHEAQKKKQKQKKQKQKKQKKGSTRTRQISPSATANPRLDSILAGDTSLRFLLRCTHHLHAHLPPPTHSLPLSLARRLHRELGLPRGRSPSNFALRYPLLLSIHSPPNHLSLTPLSLSLLDHRRRLLLSSLPRRALSLTKLLMLSKHHRIPLPKIHHSRHILGLPHDFRCHIPDFPHLFRLSGHGDVPFLELADWDPTLAISHLEKDFLSDEPRVKRTFRFRVPHAASLGDLDHEERRHLDEVTTFPLVSPYSDGWRLDTWTVEAEKYRVGVLHEFLSLTLEKRAWIHEIMEFKEELCLTRKTYEMLRRQSRAFYLSGTEMNWAVFLREAYGEDGELREKDPLVLMDENWKKYASMTEDEYRREQELPSNVQHFG